MADPQRSHILGTFENALNELRNDVLMMASLTERTLANAMRGLLSRDEDACTTAIADDEEIDQLEIEVDKAGIEILMRFQPVASDLRQVVSAMRVSSNLERVGDQAVSIARRARKLNRFPVLTELDLIERMYRDALALFRDAVDAFVRGDAELARSLKPRDRQLDDANREAAKVLTECMVSDSANLKGYLSLIFIARNLERVGDHATNMAEDAVYAANAEDIRHSHRLS